MAIFVRLLGAAILVACLGGMRPAFRYVGTSQNRERTERLRPDHGSHEYEAQKVAVITVLALMAIVGATLVVVG